MLKLALAVLVLALVAWIAGETGGAHNARDDEAERPEESNDAPERTDAAKLDEFIRALDVEVKGGHGRWEFAVGDMRVMVICDEGHDRMRILTGIIDARKLKPEDLQIMMKANFDRALDARYAISNNILWAAYLHPLSTLDEVQFRSATAQVLNLRRNYGTSYASGGLIFGGDQPAGEDHEVH